MAQVIRVDSHPVNFSLLILRRREVLEPIAALHGWDVEWVDYSRGETVPGYWQIGRLIGSVTAPRHPSMHRVLVWI